MSLVPLGRRRRALILVPRPCVRGCFLVGCPIWWSVRGRRWWCSPASPPSTPTPPGRPAGSLAAAAAPGSSLHRLPGQPQARPAAGLHHHRPGQPLRPRPAADLQRAGRHHRYLHRRLDRPTARHRPPPLVDRLVLVAAACRPGRPVSAQRDLARFTLAGRPRRAWAATGPELATTATGGRFYAALLWLAGAKLDPEDPSDMLIVIDAEDRFDAASQLHRITAPTLIIAGERDRNYTELFWETAERIPGARLRLYPGKGHAAIATLAYQPAVGEPRLPERRRAGPAPQHRAEQEDTSEPRGAWPGSCSRRSMTPPTSGVRDRVEAPTIPTGI